MNYDISEILILLDVVTSDNKQGGVTSKGIPWQPVIDVMV